MAEHDDREQRTEEATPRRREEARDRGQVALSTELVSATSLAAGLAVLLFCGGGLVQAVALHARATFGALGTLGREELDPGSAAGILRGSLSDVAGPLCLVVLPVVALAALAAFAQVGLRIAPRAIEIDPGKIDPVRGAQRLFGARSWVRTALAALKVALVSAVVAAVAWSNVPEIVRVGTNELGPLLAALGRVALHAAVAAVVAIVALGLLDLVFQRFQLRRDLRMTRQELKEEHRLTEGDPHVRARIRQIQREVARRRMLADVPRATVVVTNPTHVSVALRYEPEEAAARPHAPVVVAKGVDHLAWRIRELATENGVVCHEDVPLARALYAQVAVGQEIPEELYAAVAAVLSHVYRLRGIAPRYAAEA
jgi:flagellar biosynthetic protein FlhB